MVTYFLLITLTCNLCHPKIEAKGKQDELVAQESGPSPEVCPLPSSVYLFKTVSPHLKQVQEPHVLCQYLFPEDCSKDFFF